MKHYLEITLLPNEEIPLHFLWSKVFQQIHLGLVEMQDDQKQVPIGVSFPGYVANEQYKALCSKLRLFAQDEATLIQFNAARWLERLSDYVHCTSIRPVPEKLEGHALYQRLQPKTNKERLARRYAKRHGLDFETALHTTVELKPRSDTEADYKMQFRYCDLEQSPIAAPFIRLKSLSSDRDFCLRIKKTAVTQASAGGFSSYGLSSKTTVPEF